MTAIATAPAHEGGTMSRIWRVVKLHFANPFPVIITPWMVVGIIFLASLTVWWVIGVSVGPEAGAAAAQGFQYSGAVFWIFVYMLVVAVLAMNASFAYALGFSSTRRDYYLGTALTFVILSALYTAAFVLLGQLERATNGWGVHGVMFSSIVFGENAWQALFCVFATFMFFFFVGALAGSVYVRWRITGMIAFFLVLGLVLIGGAALLTLTSNWGTFGSFFANAGFIGSYAWSFVLTALFAIAGFFNLRRATPRS